MENTPVELGRSPQSFCWDLLHPQDDTERIDGYDPSVTDCKSHTKNSDDPVYKCDYGQFLDDMFS